VKGPRIVFMSGLSGSGKTTAMAALEDLSFYCADNLPVQLIDQFLELCRVARPPIERIALAIDAREQAFLHAVPGVLRALRKGGADVEVLFLDCTDEALLRRYRETRRVHPLSPQGSVEEGIHRERALLAELASLADHVLDTSQLNVHELRAAVVRRISGESRPTLVNLSSFGFRYGVPPGVEMLFDVRCLPNPYFEDSLRESTGKEVPVASYVLDNELGRDYYARIRALVDFVLPRNDREGKAYLSVAVGCTGGRHRSVAVIEALAKDLRAAGREVTIQHRDVERR
jgi:UPF0042 nucleotide-binding protein